MPRGGSSSVTVGAPSGVASISYRPSAAPSRRKTTAPSPLIVQRLSAGAPRAAAVAGGGGLVGRLGAGDRRDRALDPRLEHVGVGAHHQRRAFRRDDLLRRIAVGGEVEQDRRLVGVGGRVDPGVEPRRRGRGGAVAPVEGGGDPAVALRPGDERGGDRRQQDGESQRARIAPRHARGGSGGNESLDLAGEAVAVQRPQRRGGGVFAGHGEPVVERGGGPMRRARIAVEAVEGLGADGAPQPRERGERDDESDGERRDAADSRRARRACHRPSQDNGEEQRDERRRPHQRRPEPLEDDHRLGAARQRRQLRADARRPVAPRTVSLLRIQRGVSAPSARRSGARQSSVAATTAEVCRGRSIPRRSAAA